MIMGINKEKAIYRVMTLAIIVAILFFLGRIVYAGLIAMPYPKEFLEASNVALTNLFIEGKNPYSQSALCWEVPGVNYNYPFLNSLIAAIISKATGCGAVKAHFAISLLSIIATGILGFVITKDYSNTTVAPLLVSILFMLCHWRYGYISAAPDDLGLFLFILTSYISVNPRVKNKDVLCAVLITLCFYTKQYFVFVAFAVFVYTFLYSKRMAIRLFLWTLAINLLAAVIIMYGFPLYWTKAIGFTYAGTVAVSGFNISNVFAQMKYILAAFTALFLIIMLAFVMTVVRFRNSGKKVINIQIKENDAFSMFIIQILVMLLPLIYIGRNDGSYIIYFLQLWMPSVIFVAVICLERMIAQKQEYIFVALYIMVAFCSIYFGFGKLPLHILTQEEIADWDKAIGYIDEYGANGEVFYERCLAFESFKRKNGECLCGHDGEVISEYSYGKVQFLKSANYLFPYAKEIADQNLKYHQKIEKKIRQHQYALITFDEPQCYYLLDDEICRNLGYKCIDRISLRLGNMPYEVAFFIPEE